MKTLMILLVLILAGCGKSPTEPDIMIDICVDTFSPAGGTTLTIRPGEPIPYWPGADYQPPVAVMPE